jgi:nitrite reductase/ring-hydroxylating ferredoxin subunit
MADPISVAKTSELAPGQLKHIETDDGTQICLANVDGNLHAIGGECTHQGGPLGEGELDGNEVICPWHGGIFNVTNGQATGEPAEGSVPVYQVSVEGEDIRVILE